MTTLAPVADNAPVPSPSSFVFDHPFVSPTLNPNHAPVVSINHPFSQTSEWSSVGGWISYSDADGDAAVQYQFRDDGLAPNSAYLLTPANAHNPAGTIITVAPTDLTSVLVHSGDPDTSDTMWVRAFDGSDWSAWAPIYFATTASNVSYGAVITLVIAPLTPFVFVQIAPDTLVVAAQPGPDTFLFQPNSSTATISHFDPAEDLIRFQGTSLADFAAVLGHTADNGRGDAVITYDAHSAITLEGVTRDMLHASNFLLV
jgi:hypothetical protein